MKYQLFSFEGPDGFPQLGVNVGGKHMHLGAGLIDDLLRDWHGAQQRIACFVAEQAGDAPAMAPAGIRFLPPLRQPGVIYGAGANYRDHVVAMARAFNMALTVDPKGDSVPPWHFIKAGRGTLAAHGRAVPYPGHTQRLDWEAELAVVIGKTCRNVPVAQALDVVAGYTVGNDLSARDNLRRDNVDASSPFRFDWIGHKCFEGSCPLGPYLTPAEFIESPERLDIKLWVNDELKQDSNTANHLYSVAEQIAYLSERLTLYPGDVLLTGTPAGVGMESGTFLKRGDSVRVWIEGLGELCTLLQ
ncbi:2-keto-4-pentenoate hydratase [Cupriavidus necator]|uniref:2-keto-4-pentenoate hydratase n=1 Tax=Cupriavidus necator TaxID=106590 RepID=A0A1U9UNJ1_CUPNE|nr:fumarylacetoacetate hydrolase family protein [Cupriavidus necator]AQV94159.1 2-keto-4-pentenoate hydratase [Cupriavidus necator]